MDNTGLPERFLAAVVRQADIAQWHVDAIGKIPAETWAEPVRLSDGSLAPSIEVQAHIEGSLHALRNAEDKAYECVLLSCGRTARRDKYEVVREYLDQHLPQIGAALRDWSDPFVRDVRSVRNIATYRAETKRPVVEDWLLQDPGSGTGYRGDRKAREYCAAAAAKARELVSVLEMFIDATRRSM